MHARSNCRAIIRFNLSRVANLVFDPTIVVLYPVGIIVSSVFQYRVSFLNIRNRSEIFDCPGQSAVSPRSVALNETGGEKNKKIYFKIAIENTYGLISYRLSIIQTRFNR